MNNQITFDFMIYLHERKSLYIININENEIIFWNSITFSIITKNIINEMIIIKSNYSKIISSSKFSIEWISSKIILQNLDTQIFDIRDESNNIYNIFDIITRIWQLYELLIL